MQRNKLLRLICMALCCDLGLVSKRLIAPAASLLTDAMHIPGGIGTSFSLMFLVLAASLMTKFGTATAMGAIQSLLALSMGMVGSMGVLSPVGYIVPGIVIDIVLLICRRSGIPDVLALMLANMLSAFSASLAANWIVFQLNAIPLALYCVVALFSGGIFGVLASQLYTRLKSACRVEV